MAITSTSVSVGTSSTLIATNAAGTTTTDESNTAFLIKNTTASATVYVGPSGVTTANGWPWEVGDGPFPFDLEPGESLYGVVASGSQTVKVLGGGR